MPNIRLSVVLSFALLTATLLSCDDQRLYEDNHEFKKRVWVVSEEPVFEFHVPDSMQSYAIYYNLRNSLEYPYARIFVTYTLYDSASRELASKLVYNDLFDAAGRPYGESGLGDLYDHQFRLLDGYQFLAPGKYAIRLTQFMRQDTLPGVLSVGVRVERKE